MAYISVTDAVERTGRGHTTIYRLCRKYERTNHIKREDRKFLIDEEFLTQQFSGPENHQAANQEAETPRQELVDLFIQELQNEKLYYRQLLDRKDEQLERKDEIIGKLQERQADLYHFLHHQTQLLERLRQAEPEAEGITSLQEVKKEQESIKPGIPASEVRVVYAILASVGFILMLALIFVDEIRALAQ